MGSGERRCVRVVQREGAKGREREREGAHGRWRGKVCAGGGEGGNRHGRVCAGGAEGGHVQPAQSEREREGACGQ